MAITFDAANKVIMLDSYNVSEKQIWSAYVDWSVLSDNLKYGVGLTQIGGFAPVALYIFLQLGWKVRPKEADGITTIKGNLLVQGGGSPITATIGSFNVLVNMETPVLSTAIEVAAPALTSEQSAQITAIEAAANDIRDFKGLTLGKPATFTPSGISTSTKSVTITGDGKTTSTVTRNA
jgi:hypothetical protein